MDGQGLVAAPGLFFKIARRMACCQDVPFVFFFRPRFARPRFPLAAMRRLAACPAPITRLASMAAISCLTATTDPAFTALLVVLHATCVMPRGDPRCPRKRPSARCSRSEPPCQRWTRRERCHRATRHGNRWSSCNSSPANKSTHFPRR